MSDDDGWTRLNGMFSDVTGHYLDRAGWPEEGRVVVGREGQTATHVFNGEHWVPLVPECSVGDGS